MDSRMPEQKIKPCPFCGGKAFVNRSGRVICDSQKCMPRNGMAWSVEAWNNRPVEDALATKRDEVVSMLSDCVRMLEIAVDGITIPDDIRAMIDAYNRNTPA